MKEASSPKLGQNWYVAPLRYTASKLSAEGGKWTGYHNLLTPLHYTELVFVVLNALKIQSLVEVWKT